jgi:hypothetical protein
VAAAVTVPLTGLRVRAADTVVRPLRQANRARVTVTVTVT